MNRLQFLTEMKKSLIETTKEISSPFIEEKVSEIDHLSMQMLGLKWVRLEGIKPSSFKGYRDHFVNGVSLLLFSDGYQLIAYGKKCTSCNSLVNWISFEKKLKCFSCEKTYSIEEDIGDLTCKRHYIKEQNEEWFIGI